MTTSVRMPSEMYNALVAHADAEIRPLNSQIVLALKEWLASHPLPKG